MKVNNSPIGVFDSGLGGLNVLKELKEKLPNESFIYLGDTKRFPYGSKSKETILQIAKENIDFLVNKGVKLVVIACGTVTSQALMELKDKYNTPILGIIEPTIYGISNRINQEAKITIGVIATKGTIKSNAWEKAILKYIPNANVINQAAPLLATMAEEGWINNKVAEYTVKEYMKNFKKIDKLILGCTHYPLFAELMKKELDRNVELIDTGREIASYLSKFLIEEKMQGNSTNSESTIYLTDIEENFLKLARSIISDIKDVRKVEL